ncbi:MAG TPA: hypothetical protein VLB80_00685 [Candidatus Babeliales bacterium]|nr:hypothetical protein [Candidatus Babeliales bacterium]
MKKPLILFGMLLTIVTGLNAFTKHEVFNRLSQAMDKLQANEYGTNPNGFDDSLFNNWYDTLALAKKFVIDNSKNLIGIKDSDIIRAITYLLDVNNTLCTKVISIVRNPTTTFSSLNEESNKLVQIKNALTQNMSVIRNKLQSINFSKSKEEAREIVLIIAGFLQRMIAAVQKKSDEKMSKWG